MNPRIARMGALTCLVLVPTVFSASRVTAAVVYNSAGSLYSANFDRAAGAAATSSWVNDSTVPGWYAYQTTPAGAVPQYRTTSSLSSGIYLYLFRIDANATDHALGTKPLDASGSQANGVPFQNLTGQTLTSITLGYTGEQWIDQNTANQNLVVAYQTFSTAPADTTLGSGSWTQIPELQFDSPIHNVTSGGTSVALDGNADANRHVFAPVTVNVNWAPNDYLWVRWFDTNSTGTDHGLAIDDVNFSANVPEPASLLSVLGLAVLRRKRR